MCIPHLNQERIFFMSQNKMNGKSENKASYKKQETAITEKPLVQDPPVPNRAHTEMKNSQSKTKNQSNNGKSSYK